MQLRQAVGRRFSEQDIGQNLTDTTKWTATPAESAASPMKAAVARSALVPVGVLAVTGLRGGSMEHHERAWASPVWCTPAK